MLPVIRVSAPARATASFIVCHGLGDSGEGWTFLAEEFHKHDEFKHINFIFPNAPVKPLYINGNAPVSHWFNIYEFGNPFARQDEEGFWKSCSDINDLVKKEIDSGIPSERIVVGGFSQGGIVSLGIAASSDKKLAGFVDMSGIFAMKGSLGKHLKDTNKHTPIFHGAGDLDPVFNIQYARDTAKFFKSLGFTDYQFHEYIGMVHTTCPDEIQDIAAFIRRVIPAGN
ncbi:DEKNAAC102120 [Brettanomyces naardenensis]|uniref:Acyl-protein thioesterase 1 n=1 Tax=Brettanomyces naardenensis TaxID=13370 RepID=A0A448YK04_BRENA|nr:DEKNAAC102120 [Brettanomyces naardenensis]